MSSEPGGVRGGGLAGDDTETQKAPQATEQIMGREMESSQ